MHLSSLDDGPADSFQRLLTMVALLWAVRHHLIGRLHQLERPAWKSWLSTALFLARRLVPGALACPPIARWRLATVVAILRQAPFQFGHAGLQVADLLSQVRVLCFQMGDVFFCCHGLIVTGLAIPPE